MLTFGVLSNSLTPGPSPTRFRCASAGERGGRQEHVRFVFILHVRLPLSPRSVAKQWERGPGGEGTPYTIPIPNSD